MVAVVAAALWQLRPPSLIEGPKARVLPITRLAGEEQWPAFSPDGEQVAFSWSGEKNDNADIYIILVGGTEVRRVTTSTAEDYAPSWSPDGRRIAFLRKNGRTARIHVVSPLGGPDPAIADFPVAAAWASEDTASRISWSPDGRYIVAGRDRSAKDAAPGIYLIPMSGGEPRAISRPTPPAHDISPVYSPNGRRLAYSSCDVRCDVRVIDVNATGSPSSEPRTATPRSLAEIGGLAWSRDGRSIVFSGFGPDPAGLWRVAVDGRRDLERIELAGDHAQHPATVASRDRLAFSRYSWEAHIYRFDPALPDERIAPSSSSEGDPSFSPDGRRLAFTSHRSGDVAIWVAGADGSAPQQLTRSTGDWQGSPSWSPDGRTIAFDLFDANRHVHIWTVDADGGPPRQVTNDPGDQIAPTWSVDGQWIYFSARHGGEPDIWRVRPTGGPPQRVTRTGSGFRVFESLDASVLYQPKEGNAPLLLLPRDGGASRVVAACVRNAAFAIARRAVFYVACDGEMSPSLHVVDLVSRDDRTVGRLDHFPPDTSHVNLAVSSDGKTVLYRGLVRKGGDLMLIDNFR